ncbi:unnamed protein product [Macrosiphum euphorbiae]|uniref:Uncharacterized protein n=1 Tax=Macrosiphum euphorbiae TaxID=13131 RepID=A0AAV0XGY1_9HEMI|nr:unnamed protein product [Macrosiphum euphorbiae]
MLGRPTTGWPSWASITRSPIIKCPTASRTACAELRYSSDNTHSKRPGPPTSRLSRRKSDAQTRPDVRHRQVVLGTVPSSVKLGRRYDTVYKPQLMNADTLTTLPVASQT